MNLLALGLTVGLVAAYLRRHYLWFTCGVFFLLSADIVVLRIGSISFSPVFAAALLLSPLMLDRYHKTAQYRTFVVLLFSLCVFALVSVVMAILMLQFYPELFASNVSVTTLWTRGGVSTVQFGALVVLAFLLTYATRSSSTGLRTVLLSIGTAVGLGLLLNVTGLFQSDVMSSFMRSDLQLRYTGLNGEPRALARTAAVALLLLLLTWDRRKSGTYVVAAAGLMGALILATSTSALGALLVSAGATGGWLLLTRRKWSRVPLLLLPLALVALLPTLNPAGWDEYVSVRVDRLATGTSSPVDALEIFDRAAVLVFYNHPELLLFGVGNNMISFPASSYTTARDRSIFGDQIRSVPHMGILRLGASLGVSGCIIFIMFFFAVYRDMKCRPGGLFTIFVALSVFTAIVYTDLYIPLVGVLLGLQAKTRGLPDNLPEDGRLDIYRGQEGADW